MACAGKGGNHGGNGAKPTTRHKKKKPAAAAQQQGSALAHADSGARYRVRIIGEPERYLYQHGHAIVAHSAFFSLFRWQPLGADNATAGTGAARERSRRAGPCLLGDHAGGHWLTVETPLQLTTTGVAADAPPFVAPAPVLPCGG